MDDSPWDDDELKSTADTEWSKISSEFTNAGYREGITAGKHSTLQEGFDDGYASVGAPLGRSLGTLLGASSALLSLLTSPSPSSSSTSPSRFQLSPDFDHDVLLTEIRDISSQLSDIRLADIAPPDLEAESHAREHLIDTADVGPSSSVGVGEVQRRTVESTGQLSSSQTVRRPTMDDVERLRGRLESLIGVLGFSVDLG